MDRVERGRHLRMLMTLRLVTVTTLLICSFGIEYLLLPRPAVSLRPLFLLAAVTYGMALIYLLIDKAWPAARGAVYLQLVGDALAITLFVQITGGLDSPMSFVYLLPIAVASMLLYRRGGLLIAATCWLLYAGMITLAGEFAPLGTLVPIVVEPAPGRVVYLLLSHLIAMIALGWLASSLSVRLQVQGDQLLEGRRAVQRLQALNENIIESINSGLITTDPSGCIQFLNRGGREILGFCSPELEGISIAKLLGMPEDFIEGIRRELRERRRLRFERDFTDKNGRSLFLGFAVSLLHDKSGRPLGFIFIFQDLTEIHALEQEVRLKERMAALGQMAAGMAHELRNPLAAISGSVQYLKGSLQPDEETAELMDIILRESVRLDSTIRDFLTFARPGTFASEPTDVVRLLEDNLKLLRKSRELIPGHRIRTEFAAPSIEAEVDPNRLKQVFWNLTTNALKAMPEGGTLTVGAALGAGGDSLEIQVRDEGVGMSDRQREAYFQPFSGSFREGTGLGAAIVYRLIEEHDGKIEIRSREGRGTTILVRLPRRHAAPTEVEAVPLRAAGGER